MELRHTIENIQCWRVFAPGVNPRNSSSPAPSREKFLRRHCLTGTMHRKALCLHGTRRFSLEHPCTGCKYKEKVYRIMGLLLHNWKKPIATVASIIRSTSFKLHHDIIPHRRIARCRIGVERSQQPSCPWNRCFIETLYLRVIYAFFTQHTYNRTNVL